MISSNRKGCKPTQYRPSNAWESDCMQQSMSSKDRQVIATHKREFKCTHTRARAKAASAVRRMRRTKATTNDCQSQKQQIKSISEQQQPQSMRTDQNGEAGVDSTDCGRAEVNKAKKLYTYIKDNKMKEN